MAIKTKVWVLLAVFLLFISGGFFLYLKMNGIIKIGADAVVGCQNTRKIAALFGPPGAKLVQYNFFGNIIPIHELVVPYLDNIQKEIKAQKINYNFSDVTSFNIRQKRGGGGTSLHSWGIAIDINPATNPQKRTYDPPQYDIPGKVIEIFKNNGFFWGGDWPGERDPMHFEWYGAQVSGQTIDEISHQKVIQVATYINKSGSPNTAGDFNWVLPYGVHGISAKSRGYKDSDFEISLGCFDQDTMDIGLNPVPENVPGSVAGNVKITGNYAMVVPANIYLDGRLVSASTVTGDYYIPNVKAGKHKVEARIMFFPGGSTDITVVPGDDIKDANILIGR